MAYQSEAVLENLFIEQLKAKREFDRDIERLKKYILEIL